MRRVLVTNDDGPSAPGLAALVRAAASNVDRRVLVAVPAADVSSTGTAVDPGSGTAIEAKRGSWPDCAEAYEVSAYPATIVTLAATGAFGPPPDLVLAGVNHGMNIGRGLIHSSTVGAAMTAAVHHLPAVAFSAALDTVDWLGWQPTLVRLIDALPVEWPAGVALSVNLPARPVTDPERVVWCRPAVHTATGEVAVTAGEEGRLALRLTYRPLDRFSDGSDASAVAAGRVALTCLTLPYAEPVGVAWQDELLARVRDD